MPEQHSTVDHGPRWAKLLVVWIAVYAWAAWPANANADAFRWSFERVAINVTDANDVMGFAVRDDGVVGISYHNQQGNRNVILAERSLAGTWSKSVVDPLGGPGDFSSLAYSPVTGQPVIAYTAEDGQTRLASRYGSWQIQARDPPSYPAVAFNPITGQPFVPSGFRRRQLDLTFDPLGNPALAHYGAAGTVTYENPGIPTGPEILDTVHHSVAGVDHNKISLVFDADGVAHIAYVGEGNRSDLIFASRNGSWQRENLGVTTMRASLVFDSDNHPLIAYQDNAVLLAIRNKNTWQFETVHAEGFAMSRLLIDSNDRLHMAMMRKKKGQQGGDLYYAVGIPEPAGAGVWSIGLLSLAIGRRHRRRK